MIQNVPMCEYSNRRFFKLTGFQLYAYFLHFVRCFQGKDYFSKSCVGSGVRTIFEICGGGILSFCLGKHFFFFLIFYCQRLETFQDNFTYEYYRNQCCCLDIIKFIIISVLHESWYKWHCIDYLLYALSDIQMSVM